ncbi:MAG TPA: hypothetical protein VJN21_01100 [Candidatus Acidoferrales bacterium]|nr:hypothetical protein [Candidatus Acidoferrales bacterium]
MTAVFYVLLGIGILGLLFWLLLGPKWSERQSGIQSLDIEQLEPLHCRHFSQIQMLLRPDDRMFVERRAAASIAHAWKRERRRVLITYLKGLAEDFARLEYLARLLASLSPEVSRQREWEWFWLGMQFRLMLRLLHVRIAMGSPALPQYQRLTDFVASHAAGLESHMAHMAGVLPSRMRTSPGT